MAHLDEIRGLAEYHATRISSSPRDWMNYLDTAARLYRYPFMDQLLIHAQRPKATACASLELWNEKMLRWVNRGAKGIALLDETMQKTRLRYVFDIQDTHKVKGGRTPYLWRLQEKQQEELLNHLEEVYGLEAKDTGSLSDSLMATAKYMVEENLDEYLDGLTYRKYILMVIPEEEKPCHWYWQSSRNYIQRHLCAALSGMVHMSRLWR